MVAVLLQLQVPTLVSAAQCVQQAVGGQCAVVSAVTILKLYLERLGWNGTQVRSCDAASCYFSVIQKCIECAPVLYV
jgi:uncharacterized membrane protein YfbV (UPF0208 family)